MSRCIGNELFVPVVESWTENPEFVKYVAELTSYGTDRLGKFK